MELIIICILSLAVFATALVLVLRLRTLMRNMSNAKHDIELQQYYASVARIAAEHVDDQQLALISEKAERAINNAHRLDGFAEHVRPVLQYVIDSTTQLAEGQLSPERRAEVVREIDRNSAKLTNLIENVLLLARINSDNVTYEMQPHGVEDIVVPVYNTFQTADRDFYSEVEQKGELVFSIGKGIPMTICCDGAHLTKALTEVLKNAFQFVEKGNIQMGWFYKMMSNEVEIFVEDNGVGISDANRDRVFEPYFKASSSYSGLGIGLTIAKALVEKMGGKMVITSRGDFGTRLSIIFQNVASE